MTSACRPSPHAPRVGVVKFASCDGCQLTLLDLEDELLVGRRALRDRRLPGGDLVALARVPTTSSSWRARSPSRPTSSGSWSSGAGRATS